MKKKEVVFFLPDVIGGVSTVVYNYLSFFNSDDVDCKVVKINQVKDNRNPINFDFKNATTFEFSYSWQENQHKVVKRLYENFIRDDTIVVATDRLELLMVSLLNLKNKVCFLVLGDFNHYYNLATTHQNSIDKFSVISNDIFNQLLQKLPERKDDIVLNKFAVPEIDQKNITNREKLKIVFVARFEKEKGILLLPEIDKLLKEGDILVDWTIVGDGPERQTFKEKIEKSENFSLKGFLRYQDLLELYKDHDIYILPSENEGLPISMIEAMKSGLIPIVNDISGGVKDVIVHRENGFIINNNSIIDYVKAISSLADIKYRSLMRSNSIKTAEKHFNPDINSETFFAIIREMEKENRAKTNEHKNIGLNRLDNPHIPNIVTLLIRKILNLFN